MGRSSAIVQGGLSGTAISIGIALLSMPLLVSKTYEVDVSQTVINLLSILGLILLALSVLSVGVIPVIANRSMKVSEGMGLGLISGATASIVVFVLIGNVYSALIFGVIPFVEYLAEPGKLQSIDPIDGVLRPVVKTVLTGTYGVLFAHLLAGVTLSVFESIPAVWVMRKRSK
jgi:hypothetical protein